MRSPLVMATVGVLLIFSGFYGIVTDTIGLSKSGGGPVIHFSDHPVIFVLMTLFTFVLAALLFREASKRYLRNGE